MDIPRLAMCINKLDSYYEMSDSHQIYELNSLITKAAKQSYQQLTEGEKKVLEKHLTEKGKLNFERYVDPLRKQKHKAQSDNN